MSGDSTADDLLAGFYRRWEHLEEEKAALSADLRELFAEAKGNGFDTKALRAAFRRVAQAGDAAADEHEALVDLYVTSLTRDARDAREALPTIWDVRGILKEPQPPVSAAQMRPAAGGSPDTGDGICTSPGRVEGIADGQSNSPEGAQQADGEVGRVVMEAADHGTRVGAGAPAINTNAGGQNVTDAQPVPTGKPESDPALTTTAGSDVRAVAPIPVVFFEDAADPRCRQPGMFDPNSLLGLCRRCAVAAGLIPADAVEA